MSEIRRRLMSTISSDSNEPIFYAPLEYNGDVTDHVSGNSPIISTGSMTWDATKGMYKFVIRNGSPNQYVAKWNIDDRYKSLSNFDDGFTIIADVSQESQQGNGYHVWFSLPNLKTVYDHSSVTYPYIYASPFRFGFDGYQQTPLSHCAITLSISGHTAKFYKNGILTVNTPWGEGRSVNLTEFKDVGVCEVQRNNYACSMWLSGLKVYSYEMTGDEVLNEFNNR